MRNILIAILVFAGIMAGAWWFLSSEGPLPEEFREALEDTLERTGDLAAETRERIDATISAPPPLRGSFSGAASAELTEDGVLLWTNAHRADAGARALERDAQLDLAAWNKLQEMFDLQYFEHVSPAGEGPADKVEATGYAFIAVGENLALGNYRDDETLVQAWMDSPGHRENILSGSFTEIGIAVGMGVFEGHKTWMAVQMFGRPMSDCPQPSAALAAEIEGDRAQLKAMQQEAETRRAEIESSPEPRNRREAEEYNRKVDEYNALVARINALIKEVQGKIAVYNGQVQAFNACAGV